MQLTKDDVWEKEDLSLSGLGTGKIIKYLDFSKFQQVIEFYEKYRDLSWAAMKIDHPEIYEKFSRKCIETNFKWTYYDDWLFSYCFKEGLK